MSDQPVEPGKTAVTIDGELEVGEVGGIITIPVADLPPGSVVTISITIGPTTTAAEPAAPAKKYLGQR